MCRKHPLSKLTSNATKKQKADVRDWRLEGSYLNSEANLNYVYLGDFTNMTVKYLRWVQPANGPRRPEVLVGIFRVPLGGSPLQKGK